MLVVKCCCISSEHIDLRMPCWACIVIFTLPALPASGLHKGYLSKSGISIFTVLQTVITYSFYEQS